MNLLGFVLQWIVLALALVFAVVVISGRAQSQMTAARNLVMACGAFWVSLWMRVPLDLAFGKLNQGVIYSDSLTSAVALGAIISLGKAVAAILAALIVFALAESPRPWRWAVFIALFYGVFDMPHWGQSVPTEWDRVMRGSQLLFPSVVCLLGVAAITYFRRHKSGS